MVHRHLIKYISMLISVFISSSVLPLFAARLIVTTDIDSVPGSLRSMVEAAGVGDTITFSFSGADTAVLKSPINLTRDIVIIGKNSEMRGNVIVYCNANKSTLRITDCHAALKTIVISGGPLNADSASVVNITGRSSRVEMDSVTVGHGKTMAGNGIYLHAGSVVIHASKILNNSNCGIYNDSGNLAMTYSTVSNNLGGALNNQGGIVEITKCSISGNYCTNGGGLANYGGKLTISNSVITGNRSNNDGGGIYNFRGTTILSGDSISFNYSSNGSGGGIYLDSGSVTITRSVIAHDTSVNGGGIYNERGDLTITGSFVSGNRSRRLGGGVFNGSGALTLINSSVENDTALWVYDYRTTPTFSSSPGGSCAGGGIYNGSGAVSLSGVSVMNNYSSVNAPNIVNAGNELQYFSYSSNGGGMRNAGPCVIENCTFSGNVSSVNATTGSSIVGLNVIASGGGVYNDGGTITILNTTFFKNRVSSSAYTLAGSSTQKKIESGGGMYSTAGTIQALYATITGNTNGITVANGTCCFLNSIIVGNTGGDFTSNDTSRAVFSLAGSVKFTFSKSCSTGVAVKDVFGGATPALADRGGPTQTVSPGSPLSIACGAGVRAGTFSVDTGMLRPVPRGAYFSGSDWLDLETDSTVPTGTTVIEIVVDQRGITRAVPPCIGAFEFTPADHLNVGGRMPDSRYAQGVCMIRNKLVVRVSNRTAMRIELFDPSGRRVFSRTSKEGAKVYAVDLSGLAAGTYLCSLSTSLAVTTHVITVLR